MEETLNILTQNSLVEGITASDIAFTDEIITRVIDQKYKDSLSYQICDVQPLHGPTGGVFALKYDSGKVKVLRNNVSVNDDAIVDTGFTLEAIQDMQTQFGKDSSGFISKVFSGISSFNENTALLAHMDLKAKVMPALTLTDSKNAETVFFEVTKKAAESILLLNSITYRSMDAFVVLPITAAAALMGLGVYFNTEAENEAGLYLGKIRRTKFYVNPDPASSTVYVGLNSSTPGSSSIVFSPYQHTIINAIDPDSGEHKVFMVNRYTHTENALSEVGNEMLHKFDIV